MRDYRVKAFEPYHYIMLNKYADMDSETILKRFESNGNVGRSGYCDNELLVCAGIMMPWQGYGISWALLSPNASKHPHFVHKAVLEGLHYFINRFKLRRVEANVNIQEEKARRWATHLGFREESVMPAYGPNGETFIRYVIIK